MSRCAVRALVVLVGLALLVGCVPQRSVRVDPVEHGSNRAPAPHAPGYVVVRGDTLYGIAFRHGMDYRELAALNGIAAPYTIYPGQRLRVQADRASTPAPTRGTTAQSGKPGKPGNDRPGGVVAPIVQNPAAPAKPAAAPASGTGVVAATATPAPATPTPAPVAGHGRLRWQWPADGRVIGTFLDGDPTRQGINLAGNAGDEVRAAADGVVVYSGAGLIGYGELIIVKHDDTWLSAYGHNRKRLVEEGAAVKGGQRIAEMGRSGASRDMLHFEVRRNGRSVNPLGVLPAR